MSAILGELEQKVMDVLWNSDQPLKPAEVQKSLTDDFAYTTVMTILKRLVDKNILKRELQGKVYLYSAVKSKSAFANKLSTLFKSVVNSYGDIAISQFIDSVKHNPKDLKALEDYLKKLKK